MPYIIIQKIDEESGAGEAEQKARQALLAIEIRLSATTARSEDNYVIPVRDVIEALKKSRKKNAADWFSANTESLETATMTFPADSCMYAL